MGDAVDPTLRPGLEELVQNIDKEKDWRHKYPESLGQVAAFAAGSEAAAVAQAQGGLDAFHREFCFLRGGTTYGLIEAVTEKREEIVGESAPSTETVTGGTGGVHGIKLTVPLKRSSASGGCTMAPRGSVGESSRLQGPTLVAQAKAWSDYGSAESTVTDSITALVDGKRAKEAIHPAEHDRVFVLLGATSALGPALPLLDWGATVAAIARPGSKLDALTAHATTSNGTLLLPRIAGGKKGLDLLTQTPEAAQWLVSLSQGWPDSHQGRGVELVVGSYVYLDGEMHVR